MPNEKISRSVAIGWIALVGLISRFGIYSIIGYTIPTMTINNRYKNFKNALIQARHKKGLTQSDVSTRLGKTQSFVSKYESGERRLDVVEFIEVCEALMISPLQIIKEISNDDKTKIDS